MPFCPTVSFSSGIKAGIFAPRPDHVARCPRGKRTLTMMKKCLYSFIYTDFDTSFNNLNSSNYDCSPGSYQYSRNIDKCEDR